MTEKATVHKITISNDIFIPQIERMLKEEGHKSVTFIVHGFSMRPLIEDGRDKVVLSAPLPPRVGQVILAEIAPKRYALHRIIKINGDIITMQGDGNALTQTETFHADKIVGTATAFIRKGKYLSTDSIKWRTYSAIWHVLRPLRRILLAIYRRIIKFIKI